MGGGPGVYSADTTREYLGQLKCDDWATDIVPEIMDGKNNHLSQRSRDLKGAIVLGSKETIQPIFTQFINNGCGINP